MTFLESLREQRWDDHRYYHHSRVNQSLHLVSACCFLSAYILMFVDPVAAVFIGWLLAMLLRQIGHFFFEPKGYDEVNDASHAHKESIKIGYNLTRKLVLLSLWAVTPVVLVFEPTLFGLLHTGSFLERLAIAWIWLTASAILFRVAQLFVTHDPQTALVWATKILTDPFNDIALYHKSPWRLWKGERYDPMTECRIRPAERP